MSKEEQLSTGGGGGGSNTRVKLPSSGTPGSEDNSKNTLKRLVTSRVPANSTAVGATTLAASQRDHPSTSPLPSQTHLEPDVETIHLVQSSSNNCGIIAQPKGPILLKGQQHMKPVLSYSEHGPKFHRIEEDAEELALMEGFGGGGGGLGAAVRDSSSESVQDKAEKKGKKSGDASAPGDNL